MTTMDLTDEIIALEMQFWKAMKDQDGETAMRLCEDPTIVAGPAGIGSMDRMMVGGMMAAPGYTLEDYAISDMQARMVGSDCCVVAYRVHEEMTVDGQHISLDAADTSTWVRHDGQWLCACHTESIAGDPFGRDRMQGTQGIPMQRMEGEPMQGMQEQPMQM